MREARVSTYDLRVARVDDDPRCGWVITDDIYLRTRPSVPDIHSAVDIVKQGTVQSFRTELSNMEGEGHG